MHREGLAVDGSERRIAHDDPMEGEGGRDAVDLELGQRATRTLERLLAIAPGDDELGEQGVEVAADDIALAESRVDTHAGPGGGHPCRQDAGSWQEAAPGILAVNAELDAVAAQHRVVVVDDAAVGDAELLAHEVDAGDLLAHGVLDLQSGIDLEEGDGAVLADEELARAGVVVAGLADDRLGGAVELLKLRLRQVGRGSLLDQFLVASLQ